VWKGIIVIGLDPGNPVLQGGEDVKASLSMEAILSLEGSSTGMA
jgi:hypothetical protein